MRPLTYSNKVSPLCRSCACSAVVIALLPSYLVAQPDISEGPEALKQYYQDAISLRREGDLYGAIDALNRVLTNAPKMHRARLELAVSYYRAARYKQATSHAKKVLEDPNTPQQVRDVVELFLQQVNDIQEADDSRRHSFSGDASFGAGYDSNVNAGPGNDLFDINGFFFTLDPDSKEVSDVYTGLAASVQHNYRMPGSYDFGSRPTDMSWQSSASIYRKGYDDEHEFTTDIVSVSTGPAFISRTNWRANIALQIDYLRLGDDSLATYYGLNPTYSWIDNGNEYSLQALWLYRDFMQAKDENREGQRLGLGFDYGRLFKGTLSFKAGVSGYDQEGRVTNEEHVVLELYSGLHWAAWTNGSIFGRMNYRQTDYDGEVILFNESREEDELRATIGAAHSFVAGALKNWEINSSYTYTDTQSNISIFEYDRHEIYFDFIRRFQ